MRKNTLIQLALEKRNVSKDEVYIIENVNTFAVYEKKNGFKGNYLFSISKRRRC